MNVLVVGGAGYVGGSLTDRLLETDHEFRVYDNLLYEEDFLKPVSFIRGDVRDRRKLRSQLNWADAVVWLAAIVGDGACATNPALAKEINQDAVKWMAENFDGRIIFMSTCSVYGAQDGILDEESPTNPLSVYAATKLAAESYLKDKDAIIFRLGTLCGVADSYSRIRLDLVVNTLTARAVSEGSLTVFGGEQYRPLLHVHDVSRAVVAALESNETGIFNLSWGNEKILDIANKIRSLIPCEIKKVDTSFEDARNYRVSTSKAEKALGFKTSWTIPMAILQLQKILDQGRITDLNNPRYSNHGFLETK